MSFVSILTNYPTAPPHFRGCHMADDGGFAGAGEEPKTGAPAPTALNPPPCPAKAENPLGWVDAKALNPLAPDDAWPNGVDAPDCPKAAG